MDNVYSFIANILGVIGACLILKLLGFNPSICFFLTVITICGFINVLRAIERE